MSTEDEERILAEAELENAKRLFRDSYLYGTEFVDVTGKRIDPRSVSPSIARSAEPFKDIIDRRERD
jgi:hypothetical protein